MVRLRLQRKGRKKAPFYHIVVADQRAKRDGRFIERIGSYNPMTKPATIELDREKAFEWLNKGAQPTNTVRAILRFKGVMYRKHLMKGVAKGALTEDQAMAKYQEWIDGKDAKIAERVAVTKKEKEALLAKIQGTAPVIVEEPVVEETPEEVAETPAEDAPATEDAPVAEDTPAEENKDDNAEG